LDGIHSWHTMTFVESMYGQCYYMQIQLMIYIESSNLVDC